MTGCWPPSVVGLSWCSRGGAFTEASKLEDKPWRSCRESSLAVARIGREKAAMCSDYSDEGLKANTIENIFDLKLCSEILIQSKPQIELCGRCQLQVILGRIEWFKFTSVSVIIVVTFKPAL